MTKNKNTKILVIHGPNMNLLGLRFAGEKKRITLDKLNRHLRRASKKIEQSGHVIKDTLNILSIPCVTVSIGEKINVFKEFKNIEDDNLYKGSEKALKKLVELL